MSSARSAAHIVIGRPSPVPALDPPQRYRQLIAAAGSNKHDQATVLITALIGDGVTAGPDIVAMCKRLGLNPNHVGMTLRNDTGRNPVRHNWQRDEQGRYTLLS